jgi:hypothetical protein
VRPITDDIRREFTIKSKPRREGPIAETGVFSCEYTASDKFIQQCINGTVQRPREQQVQMKEIIRAPTENPRAMATFDVPKLVECLKAFGAVHRDMDKSSLSWSMMRHALKLSTPSQQPSKPSSLPSQSASLSQHPAPSSLPLRQQQPPQPPNDGGPEDFEAVKAAYADMSALDFKNAPTSESDLYFSFLGMVPGSKLAIDLLTGNRNLGHFVSWSPHMLHHTVTRYQRPDIKSHFDFYGEKSKGEMYLMPSLKQAVIRLIKYLLGERGHVPDVYTAMTGFLNLQRLRANVITHYKYCIAIDLGIAFVASVARLDIRGVIALEDPTLCEIIDSINISAGSCNYPRQQKTQNLNNIKQTSDASTVYSIEQRLKAEAELRRAPGPPPDAAVLTEDLATSSLALADECGTHHRNFYSSPIIHRGKWKFDILHNRIMEQAVEMAIRLGGEEYTEAELADRRQKRKPFYQRKLPVNPLVFMVGYEGFACTMRGHMASTHTEFQRLLVRRIMALNVQRERQGLLPHIIFGVDEYYTTKNCPRCQTACDYFVDEMGNQTIRVKKCHGYVSLTCIVLD